MHRKSRREQLVEMAKERLQELDELLIAPSNYLEDQEFEELQQEAIKLRQMLEMLE